MEHVWSVICRSSAIDKDTGQVSLLEVIGKILLSIPEELPEEGFAGFPVQYTLFSLIWRSNLEEEETGFITVNIQPPNGDVLEVDFPEMGVDLTGEHHRFHARFHFSGFPFVGDGVYRFLVRLRQPEGEWVQVAAIPIEVHRRPVLQDEQVE